MIRDKEVLELLREEPELLAVADAVGATQRVHERRPGRRAAAARDRLGGRRHCSRCSCSCLRLAVAARRASSTVRWPPSARVPCSTRSSASRTPKRPARVEIATGRGVARPTLETEMWLHERRGVLHVIYSPGGSSRGRRCVQVRRDRCGPHAAIPIHSSSQVSTARRSRTDTCGRSARGRCSAGVSCGWRRAARQPAIVAGSRLAGCARPRDLAVARPARCSWAASRQIELDVVRTGGAAGGVARLPASRSLQRDHFISNRRSIVARSHHACRRPRCPPRPRVVGGRVSGGRDLPRGHNVYDSPPRAASAKTRGVELGYGKPTPVFDPPIPVFDHPITVSQVPVGAESDTPRRRKASSISRSRSKAREGRKMCRPSGTACWSSGASRSRSRHRAGRSCSRSPRRCARSRDLTGDHLVT